MLLVADPSHGRPGLPIVHWNRNSYFWAYEGNKVSPILDVSQHPRAFAPRAFAIDRCFCEGVDSGCSGTSPVYVRLSSLGPRQRIQP